jgi:hypothetical protein
MGAVSVGGGTIWETLKKKITPFAPSVEDFTILHTLDVYRVRRYCDRPRKKKWMTLRGWLEWRVKRL